MAKFVLNATMVGRLIESESGLPQLTAEFNQYRKALGLTPVLKRTVHRYNGGGVGYNKTPKIYRKFLAQNVALI